MDRINPMSINIKLQHVTHKKVLLEVLQSYPYTQIAAISGHD